MPDAIPGQPKGRLLVFTTWKCLGEGRVSCVYWKTHLTSGTQKRDYGLGHAQWTFEWGEDDGPNTYEIDVEDIQECIALARESQREDLPPYTAVAEPAS